MNASNVISTRVPTIRRWACLVGIDQYAHFPLLRFCVNDAGALRDLLLTMPDSGYAPERTHLLAVEAPDGMPTMRLSILQQLREIAGQAQPEDMLLFYFAGHGYVSDDGRNEVFLLTANTQPDLLLPDTAVPLASVTRILDSSQARSKVIVLDACYSGVPLRSGPARRSSMDGPNSELMELLLRDSGGTAILSSAVRSDAAFESEELQHNVFAYYLLEGLRGAASRRLDGGVSVNEVHQYTAERVRQWAKLHGHAMPSTLGFRGPGELTLITTTFASRPYTKPPLSSSHSPVFPSAFSPDAWLAPLRQPWPGWIGREADLQHVRNLIVNTTDLAISIKGEPGVGKTSFINRVKHEVEHDTSHFPRHFRAISIATGSLTTCENFAAELWEGLVHCVDPGRAQFAPGPMKLEAFGTFGVQLDKIRLLDTEATYVVFLDELDRIRDQCIDLERRRITGLMSYLINDTPFPVVFVFTVARDIPGSYASPFTMDALTLHLLERAEADALVRELLHPLHVTPTDADLDWIFQHTGGHPYLTRLLMAKLFDPGLWTYSDRGVGTERLGRAADAATGSERAHLLLTGVYSTLFTDDQRRILLQLACGNRQRLSLSEIERKLRSAVNELARREYLAEAEAGVFRPRIRFVVDWLRQWSDFAAEVDRLDIPGEQLPGREVGDRAPTGVVPTAGIYIDTATQRVYVDGNEIDTPLTDLQYRALLFLARKAGQVVSYDDLTRELWPSEFHNLDEGIDNQRIPTLISRLREALGDRQKPYRYLITLPKRGYRLEHATLG